MIFYKYYPPEATSCLALCTLGFTPPIYFNDPFELLPEIVLDHMDLVRVQSQLTRRRADELRRGLSLSGKETTSKRAFRKKMLKNKATFESDMKNGLGQIPLNLGRTFSTLISQKYGILSMSKVWDSHLMWGHYSKSFTGFCIGYEMPELLLNFFPKLEVEYKPERVLVSASDIVKGAVPSDKIQEVFRTKYLDWKYENEVRYWIDLSLKELVQKNEGKLFLLEHPPSMIKEVIFGMRTETPTRTSLLNSLDNWKIDCQVSELFIADRRYDLVKRGCA